MRGPGRNTAAATAYSQPVLPVCQKSKLPESIVLLPLPRRVRNPFTWCLAAMTFFFWGGGSLLLPGGILDTFAAEGRVLHNYALHSWKCSCVCGRACGPPLFGDRAVRTPICELTGASTALSEDLTNLCPGHPEAPDTALRKGRLLAARLAPP